MPKVESIDVYIHLSSEQIVSLTSVKFDNQEQKKKFIQGLTMAIKEGEPFITEVGKMIAINWDHVVMVEYEDV